MYEAGGRIAYAPEALVEEPVPEARARFWWLAKAPVPQRPDPWQAARPQAAGGEPASASSALASAKAVYCFAAAAAAVVVPQRRNRYALRGVMHAGVVVGLLGVREIRLYGDGSRSGGAAMQPDVSFVIAAFNAEASIARAVQSALDQRNVAVEVVVVDDCSSDRTVEVARGFPDGPRARRRARTQPWPRRRPQRRLRGRRAAAGSPCSIPTTPSIPTASSA